MKSIVAAGIFTVVLCVYPGVLAYSCYNQASIQQEMMSCYPKAGLDGIQSSQLQNLVQSDPSYTCRNLEKFKTAIRCIIDVGTTCAREQGVQAGRTLPNADQMIQGVSYLCDHMEVINADCVASQKSDMFDCGYRKGRALSQFDRNLMCKIYQATMECQAEELPPCGCRTTELSVNLTRDYLMPPDCPTPSEILVACNDDGEFIIGGRASVAGASVLVVVLAAFLASLFHL